MKVGYEVRFSHVFYRSTQMRSLDVIAEDIKKVTEATEGLLQTVLAPAIGDEEL